MTNQSYKELFSIALFHTYYKDRKFRDVNFSINKVTSPLLAHYGLKVIIRESSLSIITNVEGSVLDLLNTIIEANNVEYFVFDMTVSNVNSFVYTAELPVNEVVQMHHSNTLSSAEDNKLVLFNNTSMESHEGLFGQVYIKLDQLKEDLRNDSPVQYEIHYAARKTQWRYYFINRSNLNLSGAQIQNSQGFTFNGPENTQLGNGQMALLFTSNELLPFMEFDDFKSNLVVVSDDSTRTIFKGLPIPDPNNITISKVSEQVVGSDI